MDKEVFDMIYETHAHYDDKRFDEDRDALIASLALHDIEKVINVGASIEGSKESVALAKKYDFVRAAVGVHPSDIDDLNEESFKELSDLCDYEKTVAVGEIGLDYYWEKDEAIRKEQIYWFKRQLELAKIKNLPVIIHSRDAANETLDIMKEASKNGIKGVIHCYSYSKEMAEEFVKMGYYLGIGGVVTFKNARKLVETVEAISLDRLLLETDCPYMAPEPHRGERNDSTYLGFVVKKIAEIKNISEEEVIKVTYENAINLFLQ